MIDFKQPFVLKEMSERVYVSLTKLLIYTYIALKD